MPAATMTVSLANGKSESWIADRTGHKSSQMINRYKRIARKSMELQLGALVPLDEALPKIADWAGIGHEPVGQSKKAERKQPVTSERAMGFELAS